MLHLDNDFDELMKKAGENYQLKDNGSSWNAVFEKTKLASELSISTNKNFSIKKRELFVLLFIAITNFFIAMPIKTKDNKVDIVLNPKASNTKRIDTNEITKSPEKHISKETVSNIKTNVKDNKNNNLLENISESNYNVNSINMIKKSHKNIENKSNNSSIKTTNINISKPYEKEKKAISEKEVTTNNFVANDLGRESKIDLQKPSDELKKVEKVVIQKEESVAQKTTSKIENVEKGDGFYIGAVLGPQLSQINGQVINKLGADIGVNLGYNINKRVSVELGMLFSKKFYYTAGEHFNMSKIESTMPANMQLVNLNGSSTIIEIPLTIKYNFLSKKTSKYYTTLGVSTFLLTNESNEYLTIVNGIKQDMLGNYNNSKIYLNAALNFGIGFQKKISKNFSLNIQPYIQIPLKQMGVGSIPISTFGVHFGLSMPMH